MRSIRTKITALTLAAILISIVSFGFIGIYFINVESNRMSTQTLNLICENRKDALNGYLDSIEQSVGTISRYAIDSLDSIALSDGGVLGAAGSGVREIPGRSDAQRQSMDRYFDRHLAFIEAAFQSCRQPHQRPRGLLLSGQPGDHDHRQRLLLLEAGHLRFPED